MWPRETTSSSPKAWWNTRLGLEFNYNNRHPVSAEVEQEIAKYIEMLKGVAASPDPGPVVLPMSENALISSIAMLHQPPSGVQAGCRLRACKPQELQAG